MREVDPKFLLSTRAILDLITHKSSALKMWIESEESILDRGITVSLASLISLFEQVKILHDSTLSEELYKADQIYVELEKQYSNFSTMGCVLPITSAHDDYARFKMGDRGITPVTITGRNSVDIIYEKLVLATAITGVENCNIKLVDSKYNCDYSFVKCRHDLVVCDSIY